MNQARDSEDLNDNGLDIQVANIMRGKILGGEWPDGYRVIEGRLAATLGVSRGPVRDALKRLVEEGLIESVARRGAYVRWVPHEDLREVVMIRESLEAIALTLGMQRNFDPLVSALGHHLEAMRLHANLSDDEGLLRSEAEFHSSIYAASASHRISQIWQHLMPTIITSFRNDRAFYRDRQVIVSSHQQLLEQIGSRDLDLAVAGLRVHIRPTSSRLVAPERTDDQESRP